MRAYLTDLPLCFLSLVYPVLPRLISEELDASSRDVVGLLRCLDVDLLRLEEGSFRDEKKVE